MARTLRFRLAGREREADARAARKADLAPNDRGRTIEHVEHVGGPALEVMAPAQQAAPTACPKLEEPERGRRLTRLPPQQAELQKHARELERALYEKLVSPKAKRGARG